MTDLMRKQSSSLSPLGTWAFALIFWIAGSAILALAIGWIPSAPERFRAPHWVLGAAGLLFVAGGFAPLAAQWGANSWASRAVGALVLGPLATIFNWIAFGPGTRHDTGGLSIAGSAMSQGPVSDGGGALSLASPR